MNKNYVSLARHASMAIFNSSMATILNHNSSVILTRSDIHFTLYNSNILTYSDSTYDVMPISKNLHSFIRHWQCCIKPFPIDRIETLSYKNFVIHVSASSHSLKKCISIIKVVSYVPARYYTDGIFQFFNFSN